MPRLTCNITGHSYYATNTQIESKAKAVELPVEEFLDIYVSKKAASLLQKGHTVHDIRHLVECAEDIPELNKTRIEKITSIYVQSNVRRVLSNFITISSLAIDESDSSVSKYIAFLKNN
jgi:hypothetical protein